MAELEGIIGLIASIITILSFLGGLIKFTIKYRNEPGYRDHLWKSGKPVIGLTFWVVGVILFYVLQAVAYSVLVFLIFGGLWQLISSILSFDPSLQKSGLIVIAIVGGISGMAQSYKDVTSKFSSNRAKEPLSGPEEEGTESK